jgi:Mrp family chromosome partitioning ATPase
MDQELLQRHALLITHFDPKSPVAEAYRTLRTNVQFARMDRPGKVFVVTSPTLQEGKTMTTVNLALSMAQNGQRTLLVGANLRRPAIHRYFGIEREPGLSDILLGNAPWQECIRTVADFLMGRFEMEDLMAAPGLDNLHIIESGPIPANPSELLSSPALANFLREVRDHYDIVLIDTPPVLPVTDSAIVAGQADGVILVYQAGKVGRLVLKRAKVHLESARAHVWGVVLNDVQAEAAGYATYTHYYTHYYGEEGGPGGSRGWWRRAAAAVASHFGSSEREGDEGNPAPTVDERPRGAWVDEWAPAPRYRHLGAGIVLLLLLAALLAGLLSWRTGWLRAERGPTPEVGALAPTVAPSPPGGPTAPEAVAPRSDQSSRGIVVLGLTGALGGILLWLARGLTPTRRPSRYRHVGPAIVLLLLLVGLFAGLLSSRLGRLSPRPGPPSSVSDSSLPRS